jgi:hypothetical protein
LRLSLWWPISWLFHRNTFHTSKIQGDQKVSVYLIITIQSSGAQRLFDHPVFYGFRTLNINIWVPNIISRLRHVTRMKNNMIPKIMLNYRPNGRRRLGRHLKRLLDGAETGQSRPNSWWMMAIFRKLQWFQNLEKHGYYEQ